MNGRLDNYLHKALQSAKIAALTEQYQARGFVVDDNVQTKQYGFDLVLYKQNALKTVAFVVKLLPLSTSHVAAIEQLRRKAAELGFEFRLVTISMPEKSSAEIDWFDQAVLHYLRRVNLQTIQEKAKQVAYQHVASDIHSIAISGGKALVKAGGEIQVDLNGAVSQPSGLNQAVTNGYHTLNTFPFEGNFDLDLASRTILQAQITVDDSEWVPA